MSSNNNINNNPLISFERIGDSTITTFHNCITALKEYENKSLEELRWEDYQLNRKYYKKRNVIPAPTSTITNTNLRTSTSTPSNISSQYSTPLFGTQQFKYKKTLGADLKPSLDGKSLICQDTNHVCITAMPEYEKVSFEELRYADYVNKCKYDTSNFNSPSLTLSSNLDSNTAVNSSKSICLNKKSSSANNDTSMVSPKDSMSTETDDDISCPICLDSIIKLKKKNIRIKVTLCGHILCKPCHENMIKSNQNKTFIDCPNCRRKLDKNGIHDLFI